MYDCLIRYERQMIRRTTKAMAVIVLAILAAVSCKEDETSASYPSLNGYVKFNLERYIAQNTTVTMEAEGAVHPEGGEIKYSWSITPSEDDSSDDDDEEDQTNILEYSFGDKLDTYTVTCAASASGYSSISATRYTTVVAGGVDGNGSIKGVDLTGCQTYTDSRDGKEYYYTTIGGLDWFVHNLAYKTDEGSAPFYNAEVMADVFGRYYSYEAAETACPDEWRLPTAEEWDNAFKDAKSGDLMADITFNDENEMWEFWPDVKITNSTKFNAIPAGFANLMDGTFTDAYDRAVFWISNDSQDGNVEYRYIVDDRAEIFSQSGDRQSFGASVRCVR